MQRRSLPTLLLLLTALTAQAGAQTLGVFETRNRDLSGYWHVRYSPDGKLLAAVCQQGVTLFNAETRQERFTLTERVYSEIPSVPVAFSSDSKQLAVAVEGARIKLFDVESGKSVREIDTDTTDVRCVEYSPDGEQLAIGHESGNVTFWQVQSGRRDSVIEAHTGELVCMKFSPDGAVLATGGSDSDIPGPLKLWDTFTGELLRMGRWHTDQVVAVAWAGSGNKLATSSEDGYVKIWNSELKVLGSEDLSYYPYHLDFTRDERFLVGANWYKNVLIDGTTAKVLEWLNSHAATSITAHPTKDTFVSASKRAGPGYRIYDWDLPSLFRTLKPTSQVNVDEDNYALGRMAYSRDGRYIGMTTVYKGVLFSCDTNKPAAVFTERSLRDTDVDYGSIRFHSHSQAFTFGITKERGIFAFYPTQNRVIRLFTLPDKSETYSKGAAAAPDGNALVTVTNKFCYLADGNGKLQHRLDYRGNSSQRITHTADGKTLALSSDSYNELVLIDVERGVEQGKLEVRGGRTAFSPDGKYLFGTRGRSDRSNGLWRYNQHTGRLDYPFARYSGIYTVNVNHLAVSPLGQALATASADGNVSIWDYVSGRLLATLPGHEKEATSVAFSPDGRELASGDGQGTLRRWDISSLKLDEANDTEATSQAAAAQVASPRGIVQEAPRSFSVEGGFTIEVLGGGANADRQQIRRALEQALKQLGEEESP